MIEATGLRLDERRQLARAIAARILKGDDVVHVLYEPGDATHYELVLARLGTHPFVGATSDRDGAYGPLLSRCGVPAITLAHGRSFLLSWEGYPSMIVDLTPGHLTHWTYVAEKMRLGEASAAIVAELVCMIAGVDGDTLDWLRSTTRTFELVDAS